MMRFPSIEAFLLHIASLEPKIEAAATRGLEAGAQIIKAEAKAEIGHYQGAAPPFAAWAPLAEATKADRVVHGFPADEPLLRTGEMRDSIGVHVGHHEAAIGSDDDKAVWQELGTRTIPPRSFLGGAAVRKTNEAVNAVAQEVVMAVASATVRPNRWD